MSCLYSPVETEDEVVLESVGGRGTEASGLGLPRPTTNPKVDTPSSVTACAPLGFGEGETLSFADCGGSTRDPDPTVSEMHNNSTTLTTNSQHNITPSSPISQLITPSSPVSQPITPDHVLRTPPSLSAAAAISTALPIFSQETSLTDVESTGILPHISLEHSQGVEPSKYSPGGQNSSFSGPMTPLTSPPPSSFPAPPKIQGAPLCAVDPVHVVTAATAGLMLNGHNEAPCTAPGAKVWSFAVLSSEPQAVSVVWVESPQNFVVSQIFEI